MHEEHTIVSFVIQGDVNIKWLGILKFSLCIIKEPYSASFFDILPELFVPLFEIVNDPPLEEPAHDKQAEDTGTSQDSEEKLLKASEQKESEESDVSPQKTEVVNTTLSEGKEESIVNTSTKIEKNDEKAAEQKSAVLKTTTRQQADKITKLSPLAAEFIPKTGYNLQSLVEAPEFVPKSFSQQGQRPPMLRQLSDKPENELMNCVKDVLFGLTQTPGELDSYVETLVKMLQKWLSSLDSLQEIVDLIFDYVGIILTVVPLSIYFAGSANPLNQKSAFISLFCTVLHINAPPSPTSPGLPIAIQIWQALLNYFTSCGNHFSPS